MITQPLSEALFGEEDPIGQRVEEWKRGEEDARVIGVVSDYRRGGEFSDSGFFLLNRLEDDRYVHFLVKVRPGTPLAAQEQIDKRLKAMAPGLRSQNYDLRGRSRLGVQVGSDPLFAAGVVSVLVLGMVALSLSGVLWQRTTLRIEEIGLRRALGGSAAQYLRAVGGRDTGGRQHRRNRWPAGHRAIPTAGTARLYQRNLRAQSSPCSADNLRPRDRVQPVSRDGWPARYGRSRRCTTNESESGCPKLKQ